jgi:hypothetical protein
MTDNWNLEILASMCRFRVIIADEKIGVTLLYLTISFFKAQWLLPPALTYYHVPGVPWLIIRGSGLDDWIYWQLLLKYLSFTTNYSATANLSTSQIIRHALRFLAMDLLQELSLQIIMKSSCHFLFNHLGMPALQNWTQFSKANSLI